MWGGVAGLAAAAVVAGVLGFGSARGGEIDEDPIFSQGPFDEREDSDLLWGALSEDEREALRRSGMSGVDEPALPEEGGGSGFDPEPETTSEKAGKIGMSILLVAVTVGAAVAPYLLF